MNDLNSVLLEGTVEDTPKEIATEVVAFNLASYRKPISDVDSMGRITSVEVRVDGKLGKRILQDVKTGQKLRVVGRLEGKKITLIDEHGDSSTKYRLYLWAEHIEIKFEKGQPNERD